MATPIRILSCSQHTKYHICTHKHTHTHTTPEPCFSCPSSFASFQFHSVNVWLAAKPWPLAVLHLAGALILSFFLEPIQRLKWLPFSHGIVAFSLIPLYQLSPALYQSIRFSLSLSLSVSPFFLAVFHWNPLRYTFTGPIFLSAGFYRGTQKPLLMQNHLVHVYALQKGLQHNSRIFLRSFHPYQSSSV